MNVLDDDLRQLAAHLDQELGAIKLAETTRRYNAPPVVRSRTTRAIARQRGRRQVAVFGLAAVSLIGGLIVITSRDPGSSPVGPADSPFATSAAPTTSSDLTDSTHNPIVPPVSTETSTATELTPPTTPAIPTPTNPTPMPVAAQLAELRAGAMQALAALTSFRATVERRTSTTSADGTTTDAGTATTNTVTLMADGREWSEGDQILWSSYDPMTGVSRGAFADATGVAHYQQMDGQSDAFTVINMMFGYNPLGAKSGLAGPASTVTVMQTHWQDRPATEVTIHDDTTPYTTKPTDDTRVFVVDSMTGLIVRYSRTTIQNGVTTNEQAEMSALEAGVDLPVAFPGEFPTDASVERSGNPSAFASLSIAEAVSVFGQRVVVPESTPSDARLTLTTALGESYNDLTLTLPLSNGFDSSELTIRMDVATGPTQSGFAVVDGFVCPSADGVACDPPPSDLPTLSAGALAGHQYATSEGAITIHDGPIDITIGKPTTAEALAVANSLVRAAG